MFRGTRPGPRSPWSRPRSRASARAKTDTVVRGAPACPAAPARSPTSTRPRPRSTSPMATTTASYRQGRAASSRPSSDRRRAGHAGHRRGRRPHVAQRRRPEAIFGARMPDTESFRLLSGRRGEPEAGGARSSHIALRDVPAPVASSSRPAKSSSSGMSDAAAITEITLVRANELYRPASRNQGRPAGSMRKSKRLRRRQPSARWQAAAASQTAGVTGSDGSTIQAWEPGCPDRPAGPPPRSAARRT